MSLATLLVVASGSPAAIPTVVRFPASLVALWVAPGPAAFAAPPLLFKHELAAWLRLKLGVPVHAWKIPQGEPGLTTTGILTYAAVDGDSPPLLTGPNGFAWQRIQFDAWASSADTAELLQRRLYNVLAGCPGTVGAARNVVANAGSVRSSFDPWSDGSQDGCYRESRDYRISWSDPGPTG